MAIDVVDYIVRQIKSGKVSYEDAITKYPQFKDEIDKKLGK